MVIQIWHDTFDNPSIEGKDFGEFLYIQALDALGYDTEIDDPYFLAHLEYLEPQYRQRIEGRTRDDMVDEYLSMPFEKIEIMKS